MAGLLQFVVLRHSGWVDEPHAVSSERHNTRVRQCEHITPVLRQLHWLPVRRRVEFKISTLVYRSLAGIAPVYLDDECTLVTAAGCRPLRSADSRTCVVKRSATSLVTAVLPAPVQHCARTWCCKVWLWEVARFDFLIPRN